jgi:hypothetical protein
MKKVCLIMVSILCVLCFLCLLAGAAFAVNYDKRAKADALAKYPDEGLDTFKRTGPWKRVAEYSANGDTIEKVIVDKAAYTVTTKKINGVYKIYKGFMIYEGGEFSRFFISETETKGLKQPSTADIVKIVEDTWRKQGEYWCPFLDTMASNLLYISSIKVAGNLKQPSATYITVDLDITYGAKSGYTGIFSETRTINAEFRNTDGEWKVVTAYFRGSKNKSEIQVSRQQSKACKTLQDIGFDALYGKTEPQM